MKNPTLTMRVSLQGTFNALLAAHEGGRCERFVDFSTSEVFGKYAYRVAEGDATSLGAVGEARWIYVVSKLATEHLALSYYKQYDFPAVSIRPFNIYGPGQVGEGAVHHFIARAIRNEPLVVHGDGAQIRSWCFVDDIVDGVEATLTSEQALGQAFNIGNPRSTLTIYHLAKLIVDLAGSSSEVRLEPIDRVDVQLRVPNIDKAIERLGFEPKVNLEEGLSRTIDWYRSQL
jgi:nucleoside-diphosphate-sugar epimerase